MKKDTILDSEIAKTKDVDFGKISDDIIDKTPEVSGW